ncbi:MAG: response regulator [Candidatus Zixiibacteriota bacterium]
MIAASRNRKGTLVEIMTEQLGSAEPQNALIVEANPCDLTQARIALGELGFRNIDAAISLSRAYEQVRNNTYQFILTDYTLPDGDGFEFLEWMDDQSQVIMLAGNVASDRKVNGATVHLAAAALAV